MRCRLLALDLDGTLLDEHKRITPEAYAALRHYRDQGGRVTIATGRFPASAWLHGKAAGMNAPLIALNGAVILDEQSGELLLGTPLPVSHLLELIRFVEEHQVYIHLYGYNQLLVKELNEMNVRWPLANVVVSADKELTEANYQDQIDYIQVKPVGDFESFLNKGRAPVYKATVISENPELIEELSREISGWGSFTITRTGRRRFDLNALGVSKRSALEQLCKDILLVRDEVAAIGDYDNDIDMLQWAGLGIAMGNAKEHVKSIAQAVTSTNRDNGVAQAVLKYLT
ncbi:putative phosphatase YwpJ [compost metagenome]